jgi:hypothetical protein
LVALLGACAPASLEVPKDDPAHPEAESAPVDPLPSTLRPDYDPAMHLPAPSASAHPAHEHHHHAPAQPASERGSANEERPTEANPERTR